MPLSTDIYQGAGQQSLAGGLAGALNQFTEQRARLSDLARQRQQQDVMQGYQTRALQRAEEAIPAQQSALQRQQMEKVGRDIDLGIYTRLQSGLPKEQVAQWAQEAGTQSGLKPEQIQAGIAPMMQIKEPEKLLSYYQRSAMPQEYMKAEIESQFRKPEKADEGSPVTVMQQGKPMTIMSKSGRIVGEAVPKQDMTLVQVQLPTGETVYQPRAAAAGMAVPQKAGKGGMPEDVAAAKEQASLSSQQVLDQAEELFKHPGRAAGTGASSWMGNIPGTEAKGFQANLETFKSQTFLPMVSALKGMGALSDAEGKKITASVGALDPQMPEKEFEESIKKTTRFLFNKAKAAGLNVQLPAFMGAETANSTQSYEGDKEARYQAWKARQGK